MLGYSAVFRRGGQESVKVVSGNVSRRGRRRVTWIRELAGVGAFDWSLIGAPRISGSSAGTTECAPDHSSAHPTGDRT
jgi:hypothetical protein